MDKYSFITDLMKNKSLTHSQKERMCKLIAKEIKGDGVKDSEILKRGEEIKQLKNRKHPVRKGSGLDKYIDPTRQYNALLAYNQNPILKTTCHDVNENNLDIIISKSGNSDNYIFTKHLDLIIKEFKKISSNREFGFTDKMYTLINNYLTGEGTWSSQNLKMSWGNIFLKKWANENPGMVPNPSNNLVEQHNYVECFLEEEIVSKHTNKSITNFTDLVLYFKSLWHIKYEENPLLPILKKCNEDFRFNKWSDIKFDNFSETITLYTDVDKLVQAYRNIINLIKNNKKSGRAKIVISFYQTNNKKVLSIFQRDTFWGKSIEDTIEKPFGNDMVPLINNQINGLCDLFLRAKFENDKYAEINLWNGKQRTASKIDKIEGVKYLLILKK